MASNGIGKPLRVAATIQQTYAEAVEKLIVKLHAETKRNLGRLFKNPNYAMDSFAMDGSPASRAKIIINALLNKYQPLFNELADTATDKMINAVLKHSASTLKMSLEEASDGLRLKTNFLTGPLKELVTASTYEAASLIKRIPARYLPDVQGAVMRSITSGEGLKDLVPFLNTKYNQDIRHARNVAMDQTRKAYNSINAGRMEALGCKKFKWIHTGGSMHPRAEHVAMNGNVYSLDEPPIIDKSTGQRGLPGDLPYCRCTMAPIISFDED